MRGFAFSFARATSTGLVAAIVLAIAPTLALAAPSKRACAAAYEETQIAMRRSRLLHARQALQTCLDEACPAVLRSDCAGWLKEVEARTPSVVVEASAGGKPVTDPRLFIDGELRAGGIDGRAMDIEPGSHTFRVETASGETATVTALIREGEKLKVVRIELPSAAKAAPAEPRVAPGSTGKGGSHRPVPWTSVAAGGVGVAAAAGFTWFALSGSSMKSDLESCKPDCSAERISDVRTQFIVADVLLGVTAIAVGTAAYLFLSRPAISATGMPASSRTAFTLGPGVGRFVF